MVTISRTGNTNNAVGINLNIAGTAVSGVDYASVPNTITLSVGVTTTNITTVPLASSAPVGTKTVIISLAASADYLNGTLTNATVTISDSPINGWKVFYFGANAGNPSIASDNATPAGDGVPNIIKYALGLDPLQVVTNSIDAFGINANGYFTLAYTRPDPPPADINYQVDASNDLVAWCTNNVCVQAGPIELNTNGTATVATETSMSIEDATQQFLSLRISRK